MLISQVTLDAHVPPDPKRVLAMYERSGAELCLSYWCETLTRDTLLKILQDARAARANAEPSPVPEEPTQRHHRKLAVEREEAILAALAFAECVADVARDLEVSEQVIYRVCRDRGITWPVLSPERRSARIAVVHARTHAAKAAGKAEVPVTRPAQAPRPEPVQLDLLDWFEAQSQKKRTRRGRS